MRKVGVKSTLGRTMGTIIDLLIGTEVLIEYTAQGKLYAGKRKKAFVDTNFYKALEGKLYKISYIGYFTQEHFQI